MTLHALFPFAQGSKNFLIGFRVPIYQMMDIIICVGGVLKSLL